jgi:hypothetical protein
MSHPFFTLARKEQEDWLRQSFRLMFEKEPRSIEANKIFLSDFEVAKMRAEFVENAHSHKAPIDLFEMQVQVIREEIMMARPDLA